MTLANAVAPYDAVGRAIHWATAALVVALLAMGKLADIDAEESGNAIYWWHSSLGVLVLLLTVARVVWRLTRSLPVMAETLSRWQRWTAKSVHAAFYVLLIALPLSGWLLASVEGTTVSFFGLTSIPTLAPGAGEAGEEFFEELHEALGNVLLILASAHVLAALKHYFIDRDYILQRMLPAIRR